MSAMNGENETVGNFGAAHDNNLPNYASQNSTVIGFGDERRACNGNGLNNNNHDDFKMEMKLNGNDRNEEDPLTGAQQGWQLVGSSNGCNSNENSRLKWRHRFASTNFFMVVFLIAYVLQGCYFTYFVSVITTIEKLFHIKSATIALLLNFSEVGQICTSLILTYFAGRGHRPRWIACGMFLFAIAAFGSVSPHFIYGDRLYKNAAQTKSNGTNSGSDIVDLNLCLIPDEISNNYHNSSASLYNLDSNQGEGETKDNDIREYVLIILAVSLLGIGVGQTAIATLGIPCIDDNVKSKQSPLYMAITIGVRIFGPALGYYLGSICTRISFSLATGADHTDQNFIGAWYLGLLLVAITMFFASLVMFTFPKNLRNNKATKVQPAPEVAKAPELKEEEKLDDAEPKLSKYQDFKKTIKRQIKNDILMFRTASAVLHLLPITGLYVFLPKYLETQFHMPPTRANEITGTFGVLVMGAGIFVTGVISVKFPLSARKVSLWIAFTALATAFGMFVLSLLGCPMENFKGLQESSSGGFANSLEVMPVCGFNSSCQCKLDTFTPICGDDGYTYFSACHASCSKGSKMPGGRINYEDCGCDSDPMPTISTAVDGFCESGNCDRTLYAFIAVFALTVFIHSTSEVGGMLIIMRCTHPKDKAMAMGIVQFSIGLLSNIPCPNIYGRIIDATCIVSANGTQGHCVFYNSDSFRKYFFGVSCLTMLLAFVMDIIVFLKSNRIDIDGDGANDAKEIPLEDKGAENLLEIAPKSRDADDDQHTKIVI